MSLFPKISVGEPLRHGALTVFPLFAESPSDIDYVLSDEALSGGGVTVKEVDEQGSVPELVVENTTDDSVLFVEGEELHGAKQNRVLNVTVLVAARSKTVIPVSCVESGRWRYNVDEFHSSGSHASPQLRALLKKSVSASLRKNLGHRSDQSGVWSEVARQMSVLGSSSPTAAMSDTYEAHSQSLCEYRKSLEYVAGARGLAVTVGKRVVAIDLFDKAATCEKIWPRLLTGSIMEAIEEQSMEDRVLAEDIEKLCERVQHVDWEPTPTIGLGEELRSAESGEVFGAALVVEGTVVHGSVMPAMRS